MGRLAKLRSRYERVSFKHKPRIVSTFDRVTPTDDESDYPFEEEHGWTDEEGYEIELDEYDRESDITIADKAAAFLHNKGGVEPSSTQFHKGVWYSTGYDVIDYGTGTEEQSSYHLKGFSEPQERAIYALVTKKRR